jgi:ABC-type bacteriocin/lantibiotic exporter with double-glycine peptidase domain
LTLRHAEQERTYTCTAACARIVLRFLGHDAPESDLAELLDTTTRGTIFDDLVNIQALGFDVSITHGDLSDLRLVRASRVPIITSVNTLHLPRHSWESRHAVVVAGATDAEGCFYDPWWQRAPDTVPVAQFERAWSVRNNLMALIRRRR